MSPKTPIAVTAAPAPAPWMTSGDGAGYRVVVKATTLAPPCNAANGCDVGYLKGACAVGKRGEREGEEGKSGGQR